MDKHISFSAYLSGLCTTFLGGVTLEKFAVMIGIATSLGTFAVNWYYERRKALRDER